MVIIQKIIKRAMGYRGSKSDLNLNNKTEKEQRVDGNCIEDLSIKRISMLRCTLMGLEKDYQNKVLTKSLNRNYSTSVHTIDTSQNFEMPLSPEFVSGFIDGEGSFSVTLVKDESYKNE